jgi:hypothetical protein
LSGGRFPKIVAHEGKECDQRTEEEILLFSRIGRRVNLRWLVRPTRDSIDLPAMLEIWGWEEAVQLHLDECCQATPRAKGKDDETGNGPVSKKIQKGFGWGAFSLE